MICPLAVIPLSFVSVGYVTCREIIGLQSITKAFEPSGFVVFSKMYNRSWSSHRTSVGSAIQTRRTRACESLLNELTGNVF